MSVASRDRSALPSEVSYGERPAVETVPGSVLPLGATTGSDSRSSAPTQRRSSSSSSSNRSKTCDISLGPGHVPDPQDVSHRGC